MYLIAKFNTIITYMYVLIPRSIYVYLQLNIFTSTIVNYNVMT